MWWQLRLLLAMMVEVQTFDLRPLLDPDNEIAADAIRADDRIARLIELIAEARKLCDEPNEIVFKLAEAECYAVQLADIIRSIAARV